jgi:hypothetical protein
MFIPDEVILAFADADSNSCFDGVLQGCGQDIGCTDNSAACNAVRKSLAGDYLDPTNNGVGNTLTGPVSPHCDEDTTTTSISMSTQLVPFTPTPASTCVPDCDGKNCGPNGCGGSCGICDGSCGKKNPRICMDGQCVCTCDLDSGAPFILTEIINATCIKYTLPNNKNSCCRIDDLFISPGDCFDLGIGQLNEEFSLSKEGCASSLGGHHCSSQSLCEKSSVWNCGASLTHSGNGDFLLRITVPLCDNTEFTICGNALTETSDTNRLYKIKTKKSSCFSARCTEVMLEHSFQCVTANSVTPDDESEETTPITEQGLTALYIAIPFIALAIIFIVVILACRRRRRIQNIDLSSMNLLAAEQQRPQFGGEWSTGDPYMRKKK